MSRPLESAGVPIEDPVVAPPEVIPGLLPTTGQLLIAGETDVGKSLVALEIASALLSHAPLWGALPVSTGARKALYVLGEHHTSILQGLWAKTGLPAPPRSLWVVGPHEFPEHHLVTRGIPQVLVSAQLREWAQGCQLVVYDPLASFCRGENIENDNAQMRLLLDTMTGIANDAGAACIVLTHAGKPRRGEDGQPAPREEYRVRGASAIEDAASAVFYMEKGMDGFYRLQRRKYKGTQEPKTYTLIRDPGTLRHTLVTNLHDAKRLDFLQRHAYLKSRMSPTDALRMTMEATRVPRSTADRWIGDS